MKTSILLFCSLTLACAGCGGGGGSTPSGGSPEVVTEQGPFTVRSLGTLDEPVTVTGIGATSIGLAGNLTNIAWNDFSESIARDEIAYLVQDTFNDNVQLRVMSLDKRLSGVISDGMALGPTQWNQTASQIYAIKKVFTNSAQVVRFKASGSGALALTSNTQLVRTFAVSPDDRIMVAATAINGDPRLCNLQLHTVGNLTGTIIERNTQVRCLAFMPNSTSNAFWAVLLPSGASRLVLRQYTSTGVMTMNTELDYNMNTIAPILHEGVLKFLASKTGNNTSGDMILTTPTEPNITTPLMSFFFPDGFISANANSSRVVASFSSAGPLYVSNQNSIAFTRFLDNASYASVNLKTTRNNTVVGGGDPLLGSSAAQAAIVTTATSAGNLQTFGSAVAFQSTASLKLSSSGSSSGGAQQVMTASAPEGGSITLVRFISSPYGPPKALDLSLKPATQVVTIIDSRTGAVASIYAISGTRSSRSSAVVVAACDGQGKPVPTVLPSLAEH